MSKAKHIMRRAARVAAGLAALAALGFVEHSGSNVPVRDIRVELNAADDMHFIDAEVLKQQVTAGTAPVIGTAIGKVDERAIEQQLRTISCVADVDVYHTMDGILHVKARQREPIVRVVNADGSGFYIDKDGWTMPLASNYAARVLVVTGQLNEPFADCSPVNVAQGTDTIPGPGHSRAIYAMARILKQEALWDALFTQAVMDAEGGITLIPGVGMMQVKMGKGERLQQRLDKLKMFYEQGIPQTDWRRYSTVDLRFDDQVVCTKRP